MRQDSARNAELLQARLVWTWESLSDALRAAGKEIEAGLKTAGEEIDKAFRELRDPTGAKFCFACGRRILETT